MLKNQRFGVEVEFTGITRKHAARIIAELFNTTESTPTIGCYKTQKIKDRKGREWKVMRDSSIRPEKNVGVSRNLEDYKVEMVTPPLDYEDIEMLQEIIRGLKSKGARVNKSCGIHIHVDGANHDAESLKRLVNFMTARQDLINEALQNECRRNWCRTLSNDLIKDMKKDKNLTTRKVEEIWYSPANDGYTGGISHEHYNNTRYHGINLHSFFSKGTVEFRLFNSTLHAGKIKAYIQFCLAVSAWAITSTGRISFRSTAGYTASQKVTLMRSILINRLGLSGDEFKTCRLHMMNALKASAELQRVA